MISEENETTQSLTTTHNFVERVKLYYRLSRQTLAAAAEILLNKVTSEKTQVMAASSVLFGAIAGTMFVIAVILYILFYISVMPTTMNNVPVFLDYSHSSGLPTAVLDYRTMGNNIMSANQIYDIALNLIVPETPANLVLGNFMVSISLQIAGESALTVSKPMHILFKSPLLRIMETLWKGLSLLIGRATESQSISTVMLNNFQHSSSAIDQVIVQLSSPLVETYSASLQIATHFQGLSWFMYHWWFTTAVIFILNIMLVEVLIATYVYNAFKSFSGETDLSEYCDDTWASEHSDESTVTYSLPPTSIDSGFQSKDRSSSRSPTSLRTSEKSQNFRETTSPSYSNLENITPIGDSIFSGQHSFHSSRFESPLDQLRSNIDHPFTQNSINDIANSEISNVPHILNGSYAAPSKRNESKEDKFDDQAASALRRRAPTIDDNILANEGDPIDMSGLLEQDDEVII